MKIIITGLTGFVGTELKQYFSAKNYTVTGIGRGDYGMGVQHLAELISGHDVLINLAGAPIIKRWTQKYREELWESRVETTRQLQEALTLCKAPPEVFISASGVNVYTGRGTHTESGTLHGDDFLSSLCLAWEEQAMKAQSISKTYIIRTGVVLGKNGGALPQMVLPFKLFVGGKIGNGQQVLSWIHIADYMDALHKLMQDKPDRQVFNFCSPFPVSNAEFSRQLARALRRPNFFTVPAFVLKLLYGEGAVVILEGQTVLPANLEKEGFTFEYPRMKQALENLLG